MLSSHTVDISDEKSTSIVIDQAPSDTPEEGDADALFYEMKSVRLIKDPIEAEPLSNKERHRRRSASIRSVRESSKRRDMGKRAKKPVKKPAPDAGHGQDKGKRGGG